MQAYEFIKEMEERKRDLIEGVRDLPKRDLVSKIISEVEEFRKRRNNRIYVFYGLRGIGKTTALLQAANETGAAYVDGSILSYYNLDLVEILREYKHLGIDLIFIDELTEIPRWGNALKIAHDSKAFKIIATGSSSIKIMSDRGKIARRAIFEEISPLSFREFLRMFKGKDVRKVSPDFLFAKPADAYVKAKAELLDIPDLTRELREYMRIGFPAYLLLRNIEKVSEQILAGIVIKDLPSIEGFNLSVSEIIEKVVTSIAISPPGVTSITSLAQSAGCSKTTISQILKSLEVASLLIGVLPNKKGLSALRKEKKYVFTSPSIRHGFVSKMALEENVGGLREDLVVSTLHYLGYSITYLAGKKRTPDYQISLGNKKQIIEIGGPSKSKQQLKKGLLLVDDSKLDYFRGITTIPLYLIALLL